MIRISFVLVLSMIAAALYWIFPPAQNYQRGEYNGTRYVCQYSRDMTNGVLEYDKTLCIGALADGRYFEIDNGIITIGD